MSLEELGGDFIIPTPDTNIEFFWALLGVQFGRSFGKRLDQNIQGSKWFKDIGKKNYYGIPGYTVQWFIRTILDVTHHWWFGGILWLYPTQILDFLGWPASWAVAVSFFGIGLMFDDLRDIENLKRRYLNNHNNNEEPEPEPQLYKWIHKNE